MLETHESHSDLNAATSALRELAREDGQTLVEYVLILALLALALVVAFQALAGDIGAFFTTITDAF